MKDRIGNKLKVSDKVLCALPESQVFGFVAEVVEPGLIGGVRRGQDAGRPGRVLVSCVIALPVDQESGMAPNLVRVHDPDKHEDVQQEESEAAPVIEMERPQ